MSRSRRAVTAVAAATVAAVLTPFSPASAESTLEIVSRKSDGSASPAESSISGVAPVTSADGRSVVFSSESRLVPRDDNDNVDVYVRDTQTGRTSLVSKNARGVAGNDHSYGATISADGSRVAYVTWATNLFQDRNGAELDVVVKDLDTGTLDVASRTTGGQQRAKSSVTAAISGNGKVVAFQTFARFTADDTDRREDVYVHRLATHTTRKVSYRPDGRDIVSPHLVGAISHDGSRVALGDDQHVWVRDLEQRRTLVAWQDGDSSTGLPSISGNGRYVAFTTTGGTEDGLAHVFRRDLRTGDLRQVDPGADGDARLPSLSRNGSVVAFSSFAGNLAEGDAEGEDSEVFVADLTSGELHWASPSEENETDESGRYGVALSPDGGTLAFESYDDQLVEGDENGVADVFLWRR